MFEIHNWITEFNPFKDCPWKDKKYYYYSNSWLIVRTTFLSTKKYNPIPQELKKDIDSLFQNIENKSYLKSFSFSELPSPYIKCKLCNGKGKAHYIECPECEGAGIVTWETAYSEYEVTCESCYGEGKVLAKKWKKLVPTKELICSECSGKGIMPNRQPIQIGNYHLQAFAVNKLIELPSLKITRKVNHCQAAYFQFEGGEGFIMPIVAE